jgi:hypothetical protein
MPSGELIRFSRPEIDTLPLPGVIGEVGDRAEEVSLSVSQSSVERFLDSETRLRIDLSEQLSFMAKFWAVLGYEMPEVSDYQRARLEHAIAWHPVMYRLIPSPFLSGAERIQAVERARIFPSSTLDNQYMGLRIEDEIYRHALANPQQSVIDNGRQFGLGYKTDDDRVVARQEYIRTLLTTGNAIEGSQGRGWCYPLVDLGSIGVKSVTIREENLKLPVETTLTPESLIALSLLRDITGSKSFSSEGNKDGLVNESLYQLDDNGIPAALYGAVEVSHRDAISQIDTSCNRGKTHGYKDTRFFTGRTAVSGLMA